MRHPHYTKWNSVASLQLHGRPPASLLSRRGGGGYLLRTHCPPSLPPSLPNSRALPIDGRDERHNGVSLSLPSRLRPPPPPLSFSIFRFLPVRGPLDPSLVRPVGLGEPFRPHARPTNQVQVADKINQFKSGPSLPSLPRSVPSHPYEDPISQLTPAQDCRRCRRPLLLRSPGRGPKKAQTRIHPEEPVCTSAFPGTTAHLLSRLSVA